MASKTQQSTPPPPSSTPATSAEQISDDSTFNVLQFNVNGIGRYRYRQEVEAAMSKRSLPTDFQRDEKIFRTVLLKAA